VTRDLQKVMEALTSPVRREILSLIWDRELPAGEIASAFALTKPTISQHLGVLRHAGLVDQRVAGTSRRYRARREVLRGLHAALSDSSKWSNADDVRERELADARTKPVVVAAVDVDLDQATAFRAFTDPDTYSNWLGVPVTIEDGRFACTMEWGTQIRGRYQLTSPPELIVMRWDFEDDNVPVPGGEHLAYLQVLPTDRGSRVEVHQMIDTAAQAEFMELAWTTVLGRFKAGAGAAARAGGPMKRRPARPKRRAVG
jgi:DNA-binding transcriptional ArsR family regulator/uncharacterized protein YndB with AHSA1/START domain